ncbi:MAG: hypothetical protein M3Q66_05055 [Chloroflexota bacterium]|nr:hypothetical protein [Chloroflexota bacterium]
MQLRRGLLVLPLIASLVAAPGAFAGQPSQGTVSTAASTAAKPVTFDLAEPRDFVAQSNFVQCVGASMQMMLNIIDAQDDRTARTQLRLQNLARTLSGPARAGFQRQGASVRGWSGGLNQLGAGPYRLVATGTIDEALRLAAKAIGTTGKPVGLLVWSGRHAWVMSGFHATADPRVTDDYTVTRAIILDPLYPHGSKTWGPSPKPREALTPSVLGKQFVPRRRGTWAGAPIGSPTTATLSAFSGKYVLVLPYAPTRIARDRHIAA